MRRMQVSVTGANGFLGREIVRQLCAAGHEVRAVTRKGQIVAGAHENYASGDLLDADLATLVSGTEAVVHCAARVHITHQESDADASEAFRIANTEMSVELANASKAAGVKRFVQISSVAALASISPMGVTLSDHDPDQPQGPYGQSKSSADIALAKLSDANFSVVSLRPPTIYGPGVGAWFAMLANAARWGVPLPIGRIDNRRSFAFVGNIADAVVCSVESRIAGTFIVTDSDPLSTTDLYRRLLKLSGQPDRALDWPRPLVTAIARIALQSRAQSFLGNAAYDGSNFAGSFAWEPKIGLDEALALTICSEP